MVRYDDKFLGGGGQGVLKSGGGWLLTVLATYLCHLTGRYLNGRFRGSTVAFWQKHLEEAQIPFLPWAKQAE